MVCLFSSFIKRRTCACLTIDSYCSCGRGVWKDQERDLDAQVRQLLVLGYSIISI